MACPERPWGVQAFRKPTFKGTPDIDHRYAVLTFTDSTGARHDIVLDPWEDEDPVYLARHLPFENATPLGIGGLDDVDDDTAGRIAQDMKIATHLLPEFLEYFMSDQRRRESAGRTLLATADTSGAPFTVDASVAGFVDGPIGHLPRLPGRQPAGRRTPPLASKSPLLDDRGAATPVALPPT